MSADGRIIAAYARACVGTPYRLHGRDPATGLDCAGLVLACLARVGRVVAFPTGYRLHTVDISGLLELADRTMPGPAALPAEAGDVFLVRPGPAQHHLLVALDAASFVHAHAALRRVVETPFPSPWPILRHWRLS